MKDRLQDVLQMSPQMCAGARVLGGGREAAHRLRTGHAARGIHHRKRQGNATSDTSSLGPGK